jgi:hypothetical protein
MGIAVILEAKTLKREQKAQSDSPGVSVVSSE